MLDELLRAGRALDVLVCGGEGGLSRGAGSWRLRGPLRMPVCLNVSYAWESRMTGRTNLCYS